MQPLFQPRSESHSRHEPRCSHRRLRRGRSALFMRMCSPRRAAPRKLQSRDATPSRPPTSGMKRQASERLGAGNPGGQPIYLFAALDLERRNLGRSAQRFASRSNPVTVENATRMTAVKSSPANNFRRHFFGTLRRGAQKPRFSPAERSIVGDEQDFARRAIQRWHSRARRRGSSDALPAGHPEHRAHRGRRLLTTGLLQKRLPRHWRRWLSRPSHCKQCSCHRKALCSARQSSRSGCRVRGQVQKVTSGVAGGATSFNLRLRKTKRIRGQRRTLRHRRIRRPERGQVRALRGTLQPTSDLALLQIPDSYPARKRGAVRK